MRSKNKFDVFNWVKNSVIPSCKTRPQMFACYELIKNFQEIYNDFALTGELKHETKIHIDNHIIDSLQKSEAKVRLEFEEHKKTNPYFRYNQIIERLKGKLTSDEYKELITLEYVLTQGYSDDVDIDTNRLIKLREKKEK